MATRSAATRALASRRLAASTSASSLGRWWPVLLVLALSWVAWLNAPSACALEESAWRDADAQLTRLMIRAHPSRGRALSARPVALSASAATGTRLVEQQTFALQSAEANDELLRAKRELESALGELRMCRQGGHGARPAGAL